VLLALVLVLVLVLAASNHLKGINARLRFAIVHFFRP